MAVIRLYRRFYRVSCNWIADSYNLINPTSLSAATYIKDTSTLVETVSTINKESDGVYYVDLLPSFYSYDNSYDLKWTVKYSGISPTKTLITSFKLNPINIAGSEIYTEFENQEINLEVKNQIIEVIIL